MRAFRVEMQGLTRIFAAETAQVASHQAQTCYGLPIERVVRVGTTGDSFKGKWWKDEVLETR